MESTMKCISYMTRKLHPISMPAFISKVYEFHFSWCTLFTKFIKKILDLFQYQAIRPWLHIVEPTKGYIHNRRKIKVVSISILQPCPNEINWTMTHIYYCKLYQALILRQTNKSLNCGAISQSLNNLPDAHTNCNNPSRPNNNLIQCGLIVAQLLEVEPREFRNKLISISPERGQPLFPATLCDCYPLGYGDKRRLLCSEKGKAKSG